MSFYQCRMPEKHNLRSTQMIVIDQQPLNSNSTSNGSKWLFIHSWSSLASLSCYSLRQIVLQQRRQKQLGSNTSATSRVPNPPTSQMHQNSHHRQHPKKQNFSINPCINIYLPWLAPSSTLYAILYWALIPSCLHLFPPLVSYWLNSQKLTLIINSLVLLTFSSSLVIFQTNSTNSTGISKKNTVHNWVLMHCCRISGEWTP